MADDDVWVVVCAGGTGERAGAGVAKQFRPLGGVAVLRRAITVFADAGCPVVVVANDPAAVADVGVRVGDDGVVAVVSGGDDRRASVAAGLAAVPDDVEIVAVHDAARPFPDAAMLRAAVDAVRAGADAAVPAVAVADTVKRVTPSGVVEATVPRDDLVAVQTPQVFRTAVLRRAHGEVPVDVVATDDAALVEAVGGTVVTVPGDPSNLKITRPTDFVVAEALVRAGGPSADDVRTGSGFDVHAFDTSGECSGPVTLGGVAVPHDRGLLGHSDADVVTHAVMDALLGAAALGDIGMLFPDDDDHWAGADSLRMAADVAARVRAQGWRIAHVDVTVICQAPRVGPHRAAMRDRLADALGVTVDRVSVKATTTEGLGFTGRGEGIAAQAVATLSR